MRRKYFFIGRPSKSVDSDRSDLPSKHTERLNTALASLRGLGIYQQHPIDQAIKNALYAASVYRRWQKKRGAFIREVGLCLADGKELPSRVKLENVKKRGLNFSGELPPGSVINVFKKVDKEFPEEVLLYSIDLDNIDEGRHSYDKTYENGQTINLNIERDSGGQFSVDVEHTVPDADALPRRGLIYQLRPSYIHLIGLCLLAGIGVMAIRNMAIHNKEANDAGSAVKAASDATAVVNTPGVIPAAPPQTNTDGQGHRSDPADVNLKDTSQSPGPLSERRQPKQLKRDAGGARASARKSVDVEPPVEPARPPEAANGSSKPSDPCKKDWQGTDSKGVFVKVIEVRCP